MSWIADYTLGVMIVLGNFVLMGLRERRDEARPLLATVRRRPA